MKEYIEQINNLQKKQNHLIELSNRIKSLYIDDHGSLRIRDSQNMYWDLKKLKQAIGEEAMNRAISFLEKMLVTEVILAKNDVETELLKYTIKKEE